MKKTIDINLGGMLFHLDEDAYHRVLDYLDALKKQLKHVEGCDEILSDIEARLAELFHGHLSPGKQVVSLVEVDAAVRTLGQPEDFNEAAGPAEEPQRPYAEAQKSSASTSSKRLYRDVENGFVGGVSGGLGAYFRLDPVIFRVAFLILFFGSGIGFIAYFILWVSIPGAKTTAEKLAMRGEEVNLENIKKSVEEEVHRMKTRFQDGVNEAGPAARQAAQGLGSATHQVLRGLGKLLSTLFRIIGFLMLLGLGAAGIALLVIGTNGFTWSDSPDGGSMVDFFLTIFPSGMDASIFWVATLALILGLVVVLTALIIRFTFRVKLTPSTWRWINGLAILSSMAGVIIWVFVGLRTGLEFREDAYHIEAIALPENQTEWYLSMSPYPVPSASWPEWPTMEKGKGEEENGFWFTDGTNIYFEGIAVDVKPSARSLPSIEVVTEAHGGSRRSARYKADRVKYEVSISQDSISLGDFIQFPFEDRFRGQNVRITLYLPVGHKVYLDESCADYLDNVHNVQLMHDRRMGGKWWVMTDLTEGLSLESSSKL